MTWAVVHPLGVSTSETDTIWQWSFPGGLVGVVLDDQPGADHLHVDGHGAAVVGGGIPGCL
jgi:hypothetical protein